MDAAVAGSDAPDTSGYELLELDEHTDPSPEAVYRLFEERGWGDGLPLVVPTEARVDEMLAADPGDPEEVLAVLQPRAGLATRRIVAVNAVLAGCRPEYLPIVTAVVRTFARPELNVQGTQTTTGPNAPLVIVHGPIADELGFNSGHGLFGPGTRANATVGRAIRLVLMHVGGARAGEGSKATQGQPSQYTFCVAENAAANPWVPYHHSVGVTTPNAVTVAFTENPHNSNDHTSEDAIGILTSAASVLKTVGGIHTGASRSEVFVMLCPEHAATIAADGWTRADVQGFLYEKARLTRRELRVGGLAGMEAWPPWMFAFDDDDGRLLPVIRHPNRFHVVVGGGAGKHSSVLPGWGSTTPVTVPLDL